MIALFRAGWEWAKGEQQPVVWGGGGGTGRKDGSCQVYWSIVGWILGCSFNVCCSDVDAPQVFLNQGCDC